MNLKLSRQCFLSKNQAMTKPPDTRAQAVFTPEKVMSSYVIKKHKSSYPNPIEFRLNDQLEIGAEDIEYPGWIWVKTPDGNEPKKASILLITTACRRKNHCE